jgi:subtilisin family serine protease
MRLHLRSLLAIAAFALAAGAAYAQSVSANAQQQIQALLREKQARNAVERKLSSALVYASTRTRGLAPGSVDTLGRPDATLHIDSRYGALVDIQAAASSPDLLNAIRAAGGRVIYGGASGAIRARLPVQAVEALAGRNDIRSIKAGQPAKTGGASLWPGRLAAGAPSLTRRLGLGLFLGLTTTQGVVTHGAAAAVRAFGTDGSGVRVGVLSDSAEYVPTLIASGDLPPDTQIVADLEDGPGTSEGSAMMEIIYDMAPGVRLFFASAANGPQSFADNIRLLRNTYRCDVIVDDIKYNTEGAFQDTVIARAVDDVTQSGALYFSSAGNGGNLTSGTSSAWEGDFTPDGIFGPYVAHSFGQTPFNRLLTPASAVELHWSDPWGGSSNDYDLFLLDPTGATVLAASTDRQTGNGDPFEEVYDAAGFPAGSILLVLAMPGAQRRALHLETFFGEPLAIATNGVSHGHATGCVLADPACPGRAAAVAAVAWNSARGPLRPFPGGAANPTQLFSSDGPRRIFFFPDGAPITPGNFLFATGGGRTRSNPDMAAADGVSCRTPGFSPFFGTSAAAPHAAAIAALVKGARPSATGAQVYDAMISTARDIRAPGVDRDSGYGLVMAPAAVSAILH